MLIDKDLKDLDKKMKDLQKVKSNAEKVLTEVKRDPGLSSSGFSPEQVEKILTELDDNSDKADENKEKLKQNDELIDKRIQELNEIIDAAKDKMLYNDQIALSQ